jgi:hypothetical protein
MTMDLEDRLWAQLEAAALRENRRGRAGRAAAAVRGPFPAARIGAAFAAVAVAAVAVVAVLSLTTGRTTPQAAAERVVLRGAHLASGATAFGSLWTYDAASGHLLRLDPRSHRVLARLRVPSPLTDIEIAIGADAVWAVPIQPIATTWPRRRTLAA